MMRFFRLLLADEEGQGLVEYGLIIALVAVVLVVALTGLGDQLQKVFSDIVSGLGAVSE